ncbi:MAG: prenyltransferase/squalene oxidase repeat-containing protein [Candidatus Lokiarchaeota archaeon]
MKLKTRNVVLISTIILFFVLLTPSVLAKTRQSYLTDYLFGTQADSQRFGSSYQETAYALEIINHFKAYEVSGLFGTDVKVNKLEFQDNLEDAIETMFDEGEIKIYDLYYLIKSLDILGASLDSTLKIKISYYINQTEQILGGYSASNSTSKPDMTSTYFAYEIKIYLNEAVNLTSMKSWILSCNNSDGGYGGNSTLDSSQITTYLAVYLISQIGNINDLENRTATLNYFKSFYVNDSDDLSNYGGYLPSILSDNAIFSSTFYCVSGINLLGSTTQLHKPATVNWVLNHQNFQDGGFSNLYGGTVQGLSSISASYYAFKLLNDFNSLGSLNEDVFMVEFNYIILIVVLVVVVVIIALIFFIWRKRRI